MEDGTFIEIEYTGKIKDTGEIFDLTDEETAKENRIYNPNTKYGPITIITGENMILPGLEKNLKTMKPGEKKKITLSPEEAFGRRDPNLLKVFSLAHFRKQKITPLIGQVITLGNNISGKVLSVSAGRVKMDFNHPLASRTLEYDIKLNRILTEPDEKIKIVTSAYTGYDKKDIDVLLTKENATIMLKDAEKIRDETKTKLKEELKRHIKEIPDIEIKNKPANTKK